MQFSNHSARTRGTAARFSLGTASAMVVAVLGWLALAPWRPLLAGDDWGFYESVVLTVLTRYPVVSDWLNPATVGLSIPAALVSAMIGDLWLGCMAVVGLLGVVGLAALSRLLRSVGLPSTSVAVALLVVAFFPIYLAKWSRFESAVPALSLVLVALAFYVRSLDASGVSSRLSWMALISASLSIAWAITIRQNHVVTVGVGLLGILFLSPPSQRLVRAAVWVGFPALAFAVVTFALEPSFAKREVTQYNVVELFTPEGYITTLVRGCFVASGMAVFLGMLVAPRDTHHYLRQTPRGAFWVGAASLIGLVTYGLVRYDSILWVAPQSDIPIFLSRGVLLLVAAAYVGALTWPLFLPAGVFTRRAAHTGRAAYEGGLFLLAGGYLLGGAAWGYWEYYLLEPIILLLIAVLLKVRYASAVGYGQRRLAGTGTRRFVPWRAAHLSAVCVYILIAWYPQRVATDVQATEMSIIEHAFRDHVVRPDDFGELPFGLMAWNMFDYHMGRWEAKRVGHPLRVWKLLNPDPQAALQWTCIGQENLQLNRKVVRTGTAYVGLRRKCWELIVAASPTSTTPRLPIGHRYIPLTGAEWRTMMNKASP